MAQADFDALIGWADGVSGWGSELRGVMADLKPVPPAVAALDETIDDRVSSLLVAGTNITLTYDDSAGTLTIAAAGGSGGGLTQEQAEDIVAALIDDNSDLDWTYVDNAELPGSLVAVIKPLAVTNAMLAGSIAISKITGLQTALDAASTLVANNQTGTAYTLVLTDAGKVVERNNAAANTTTVPPNSSVAFPVGSVVEVWQQGAGTSTIVAGSGVSFVPASANLTLEQGLSISLRKRATDEWAVISPGESGGTGGTDDQTASEVPFTPTGTIAATNVQAAIAELGTEKAAAASVVGVVNHGATASTARPTGYASIMWIGSVAPTNAVDATDTWLDTSV